jgi:hypothetical protein
MKGKDVQEVCHYTRSTMAWSVQPEEVVVGWNREEEPTGLRKKRGRRRRFEASLDDSLQEEVYDIDALLLVVSACRGSGQSGGAMVACFGCSVDKRRERGDGKERWRR